MSFDAIAAFLALLTPLGGMGLFIDRMRRQRIAALEKENKELYRIVVKLSGEKKEVRDQLLDVLGARGEETTV